MCLWSSEGRWTLWFIRVLHWFISIEGDEDFGWEVGSDRCSRRPVWTTDPKPVKAEGWDTTRGRREESRESRGSGLNRTKEGESGVS